MLERDAWLKLSSYCDTGSVFQVMFMDLGKLYTILITLCEVCCPQLTYLRRFGEVLLVRLRYDGLQRM